MLDEVDRARIGLLGHSGGSVIANLLVRVSDRFTAMVIDHDVNFRNRCGLLGLQCGTVPGMYPLSADLNGRTDLAIPWMKLSYGYPGREERDAIFEFFDRHLAGTRAGPRPPDKKRALVSGQGPG